MSPTFEAFLRSWPSEPWLSAGLLVAAGIYLRGWLALRKRDVKRWHAWRLAAFFGGLATIFLALASPIEPFAALLLQVHMLQHLLLMMLAPPLIWLSCPFFPLLRGLPRPIRRELAAPLLRAPQLRRLLERLTQPYVALPLYVGATWGWHAPAAYEAALRDGGWHYLEHVSFLGTALLFWHPVVRPYPSRPHWSTWLLFPYLIVADVQNTVLSALLSFSDHVWYVSYAQAPRVAQIGPLADQAAAGALMWVPGSIAYLGPLFALALKQLVGSKAAALQRPPVSAHSKRSRTQAAPSAVRIAAPAHATEHTRAPSRARRAPRFDLLHVPLVGRFLRWPKARTALQTLMLLLAAAVVYDGLHGPQIAPMNMAGILPWIHWRGLLVIGLLAAGNFACLACPFTLPRRLGRRWLPARWHWPRALRSKWLAAGLLAMFFWAYEEFSLWDHPARTAWIALAYFAAALAIDGLFRGASFCKYLCPIGQFNFVQSLVSPLEVKVREAAVCASCRTKECIRGSATVPGCELQLIVPQKSSNMDCTFCLDCVQACPHSNVGLLAVAPGQSLWSQSPQEGRSGLAARADLAALALVLTFGALANAAGMIAPIVEALDRLQTFSGPSMAPCVTFGFYLATVIGVPAILVPAAAAISCGWPRRCDAWLPTACKYSLALVPLGFSMWLAHYSFHFFTSYDAATPVMQRFAADLGISAAGEPTWSCGCCRPAAEWLLHAEILFLDFGLLLSLYAAYRIASSEGRSGGKIVRTLTPWAILIAAYFFAGVWILLQPMEMRGTLPGV